MRLYFVNGDRSGQFWELVPPGICIGREEDNDIQLLLPGISRYHAKVEYTGSQWRVTDLGSTNGTKVDGKVISGSVILEDGMQISMGEQLIRFDGKEPRTERGSEKILKLQQTPIPETVTLTSPCTEKSPEKAPEKAKSAASARKDPPVEKERPSRKETINGDDIFRKKSSSPDNSSGGSKVSTPSKRISNLLFVLLIVVLGCAVILVFMALNAPAEKKSSRKGLSVQNPFILEYEKKLVRADNVFRFYVRIENNAVLFKLDDLQSRRHFTKEIGQMDQDQLTDLRKAVEKTDFMKNTTEPAGKPRDGEDDYRKLTVGYGSQFNSVVCRNVSPSNSFVDIENALENFAEGFGLKTISLTKEQMEKEADRSFASAEELFRNYQARPENLRNAILRYKITIEFLEQFEPKPKNWITARQRLSEAEKLLKKLVNDTNLNAYTYFKRKQYTEAIDEYKKLLQYLDPERPSYQKVLDRKIALENLISNQRKRRRR